MGCSICRDSLPGLLGRRRRPHQQVLPSKGQTQNGPGSGSKAQRASPDHSSTSRTEGGQQASRREVTRQHSVRNLQATGSGSVQEQTARVTARRGNQTDRRPLDPSSGPAQQPIFRSSVLSEESASSGRLSTSSRKQSTSTEESTSSTSSSTASLRFTRELAVESGLMPRVSFGSHVDKEPIPKSNFTHLSNQAPQKPREELHHNRIPDSSHQSISHRTLEAFCGGICAKAQS